MSELLNYQFQYRDLVFGAYTDYGIESVEGIDSFAVRRNDTEMPRGHGSIPGSHYLEENDLIFKISVDKNSFEDVEQGLEEFKERFRISEVYEPNQDFILFKLPGRDTRLIRARPIGVPVERNAVPGAHIIKLTAAFISNDPRAYSAEEHSVVISPFSGAGLRTNFPVNYALNWPTGTEEGGSEAVVNNNGNSYAWPLIRIHGPNSGSVTKVILTNVTYNTTMVINTPIWSNQVLYADMETIVTASGKVPVTVDGDNRYHGWELPRDPFYLGPGSNVVRLTVEGDAEGVAGVVTWRDTFA